MALLTLFGFFLSPKFNLINPIKIIIDLFRCQFNISIGGWGGGSGERRRGLFHPEILS